MTLAPYLARTNQEILSLFNRTDIVKRDGNRDKKKGVEIGERGEVPLYALNFLEDYALIFQYFGFKLYPISFNS